MKRTLLVLVMLWLPIGAPLPALAESPELMAAYQHNTTL